MKILYLTEIRGMGGGEVSLLSLLKSLIDNGDQAILICPMGELEFEARSMGVMVFPVEMKPLRRFLGVLPVFSLRSFFRIFWIIKHHGVDIVHAETIIGVLYGGLAAFFARRPCVATCHGYWKVNTRFARLLVNQLCCRVYPVSQVVAADVGNLIISKDKVKTIPLSFGKNFISKLPNRQAARESLGLPVDRYIVMQVARFQEIKGQLVALEAIRELIKRPNMNRVLAVFVGGILEPINDDAVNYEIRVRQTASLPELFPHIMFLGNRKDIPFLISAADVVIVPSDFETFSMVTIESMASGTPVIATASGGPQEIIENKVTGILVPPRKPSLMADCIFTVLTDPKFAQTMAEKAKEVAFKRYAPDIRFDALKTEYRNLLGS